MDVLRAPILCLIVAVAFAALRETAKDYHINVQGTINVTLVENEKEESNVLEDRLVTELIHYGKTGKVTDQLIKDMGNIRTVYHQFHKLSKKTFRSITDYFTPTTFCLACRVAAGLILKYRKHGGPMEVVTKPLILMCTIRMHSENVCKGLIDLNIDILLYIIDYSSHLTVDKICSIIGQSFNCAESYDKWSVYLRPKAKSYSSAKPKSKSNEKPLRILHITDIHYDFKYKAGGNAKCGEPLCCGNDQGKPKKPEHAAGVWGDYRSCDMPLYAVENLMDAASKHDVDFIYHTGDIINHRVWETARADNYKSILDVIKLFRTKFPNKTIYHIAGNHEPHPIDMFAPEFIPEDEQSTKWLYKLLAKEWSTWLPKETLPTIRKGGYYTVLVRPGFRIIALNSNVCYIYNWWLLYKDADPYGQLQWLSDTLYEAELNGEAVHILTHVPSGDKECYKKWSHEYNRIIQRYASTIKAQFVGHTHYNELHFYYEENKKDPINVAFNGGSFTTFIDVNPNFRIYEVHPNTYQVEDYADWIYNITEANQHDRSVPPRWYKLYNFKEAYGLQSMDLPELGKFVQTLSTNKKYLDILKVRDGDPSIRNACDEDCKEEQLCKLVTSEYGSTHKCEEILKAYKKAAGQWFWWLRSGGDQH